MVGKGYSELKSQSDVTRQMVVDLKTDITEIRGDIKILDDNNKKEFKEIRDKNEEMFNHLSKRLPLWVTVLFTILGSLVVGLIIKLVS